MKNKIILFLKNNFWLILLNMVFFTTIFFWIGTIPFDNAPDEATHYKYNVEFLIYNKRLPVSGIDDLAAYNTCRDKTIGRAPCLYSYVIYPQTNYIIYGLFAKGSNVIWGVPLSIGARYASLLYGLIYINSVFLIMSIISKDKRISFLGAFVVTFIPQVLFTFSYINQDAFSLAVSSLLGLSSLLLYKKFNTSRLIFFPISIGLLLSAKLNFWVLLPFAGIFYTYLFISSYKTLSKREVIQTAYLSVGIPLLISGFWYLRNYYLYSDFLGQEFVLNKMSQIHRIGFQQFYNLETFYAYVNKGFFDDLFKSFIGVFSYMNLLLPKFVYDITFFFLLSFFVLYFSDIFTGKDRKNKYFAAFFVITLILSLLLTVQNSLKTDYQPQGRYLFPVLIPFVFSIGYSVRSHYDKYFKYLLWLFVLVLYLYLQANVLVINKYKPGKLNIISCINSAETSAEHL